MAPHSTSVPPFNFVGPWFTSREAMAYIPCRSLKGWYQWRYRHGIVARKNGTVAKADLDRALKVRPRPAWGRHPSSAANLLKSSRRQGKTLEQTT